MLGRLGPEVPHSQTRATSGTQGPSNAEPPMCKAWRPLPTEPPICFFNGVGKRNANYQEFFNFNKILALIGPYMLFGLKNI